MPIIDSQLHLVERSATGGYWLAVQQWPSGDPLLTACRQRAGYWKEPATTWQDAYGAFCWRTPQGSIFWSDPKGGWPGSVSSADVLRDLGFTPAFGEQIENGVSPVEPTPSKSQS